MKCIHSRSVCSSNNEILKKEKKRRNVYGKHKTDKSHNPISSQIFAKANEWGHVVKDRDTSLTYLNAHT